MTSFDEELREMIFDVEKQLDSLPSLQARPYDIRQRFKRIEQKFKHMQVTLHHLRAEIRLIENHQVALQLQRSELEHEKCIKEIKSRINSFKEQIQFGAIHDLQESETSHHHHHHSDHHHLQHHSDSAAASSASAATKHDDDEKSSSPEFLHFEHTRAEEISHLKQLEYESLHRAHEAVSEFEQNKHQHQQHLHLHHHHQHNHLHHHGHNSQNIYNNNDNENNGGKESFKKLALAVGEAELDVAQELKRDQLTRQLMSDEIARKRKQRALTKAIYKGEVLVVAPVSVRCESCYKFYSRAPAGFQCLSDSCVDNPPMWRKESEIDSCQHCGEEFSLFSLEFRHRCLACGAVVCDECSSARAFVFDMTTPERVCFDCIARGHTANDIALHESRIEFARQENMERTKLDEQEGTLRAKIMMEFQTRKDSLLNVEYRQQKRKYARDNHHEGQLYNVVPVAVSCKNQFCKESYDSAPPHWICKVCDRKLWEEVESIENCSHCGEHLSFSLFNRSLHDAHHCRGCGTASLCDKCSSAKAYIPSWKEENEKELHRICFDCVLSNRSKRVYGTASS